MGAISEFTRERETYKFTSQLFENARNAGSTPTTDNPEDDRRLVSRYTDTALNAFAQLGVYRLHAARCIISIFDRSNQYIVTEAWLDSPIDPVEEHVVRDDLWLAGTSIPRSDGVCDHVLTSADEDRSIAQDDLQILVVSNLADDPRFCDRPSVRNSPSSRFYAGIPIRSPRGIPIGVFAVFDDKPRDGLDASQSQFLRTISQTVMEHWEGKAATLNYRRSERMVRGLGSFVDGKATIAGWQLETNAPSFANNGQEGDLNQNQQDMEEVSQAIASTQTSDFQPARPTATPLQSARWDTTSDVTLRRADTAQDNEERSLESFYSSAMSVTTNVSTIRTNATVVSEEPMVKAMEDVFSRAANIIREAIETEGVLFLDANIGSYGGLVPDNDGSSSSSSAPSISTIGDGGHETANEDDVDENKTCSILGYSTSLRSSIDGRVDVRHQETVVPEKFLKTLLRRYPGGKVFLFDEEGAIQSSTDEEPESSQSNKPPVQHVPPTPRKKSRTQFSRQNEGQVVISLFPGARSVALVPIWDSRKERWFAGSFVWTKAQARIFTPRAELSYLRAFNTTIMAEITRLDASMGEKATSDLLGSLSHELRSPLHGVVAAVELLQDTDIDAFQGNLVHTMESCGRTLLDSIDHMLDYTKINRLVKDQRQNAKTRVSPSLRMKSFQSQMTTFSSTVELALLAEETVESLFAGHNFHKMSIAQLVNSEDRPYRDVDSLRQMGSVQIMETTTLQEGYDLQTLISDQDSVSIYIDIDPYAKWVWHVTPGAIRRIIMNLFGNSLKFTKKGFIQVSLKQEQSLTKSKRGSYNNLVLTVSDSGKGITSEFLHNRAFKPFSQEDSLSPGTGLGLSIVHQIAKALKGTVQIESQLRRGTSVTVKLPLQMPPLDSRSEPPFSDRISALKGLRVSLRGLDTMAEAPGLSTQEPPIEARLMETVCSEWLHLDIIPPDVDDVRPDIIICTAFHLTATGPTTPDEAQQPPVVVICSNALAAHSLAGTYMNAYGKGIYEFISQPAGPRKLANALILALGRFNNARASELLATDTSMSSQGTSDISSVTSSTTPTPMTEQMTPILDLGYLEDPASYEAIASRPIAKPKSEASRSYSHKSSQGGQSSAAASVPDAAATTSSTRPPFRKFPMASDTPRQSSHNDHLKFLLVDDNTINLQILVSFMKKLKYSYKTATNGLEALEAYSAAPGKYGHVLMDISMPVMDGMESTRRMRELERNQQLKPVKIIALTGLASATAQAEAFASGIDMYMTKPVRFKELVKVLAEDDEIQKETNQRERSTRV